MTGSSRLRPAWALCLALIWLVLPQAARAVDDGFLVDYHLRSGDVLEISVWGDEQLAREVAVRPDGMISFPLVGDVHAAGATVPELRKRIAQKVSEYVPDAPVTVILKKMGSSNVYVVGKVEKPGVYPLNGKLRVMQALAMAGGLNAFADSDSIIVLRPRGGAQDVMPFDYNEVAQGENLEQNVILMPGDTVVVP